MVNLLAKTDKQKIKVETLPGRSYPLGSTVYPDGVNFCVYSQAEAIELLLFENNKATEPSLVIKLDPEKNCSCYYWHIFLKGIKAGQVYAYRAYGEYAPEKGLRYDGTKVLLDPYAKAITGEETYDRDKAIGTGDNCAEALKAIVVDTSKYDWEDDTPPEIPYSNTVIYELHVGGFTSHPNSGLPEEQRGTFAGLKAKIPYLKELGITTVELLPIHSFDANDAQLGLHNYWGYSTISFFALHNNYGSTKDPIKIIDEFRDLVKALHKANIEVILDVVFNHTAEGNHKGPTLSMRGIDNKTYYMLEDNQNHYKNYSGCGNTLRANHPVVGGLILDCLRYWVTQMHVDGFRFDLASVLARDAVGASLWHTDIVTPNILWAIESDPILAGSKLIAEAWDAGGLYGVGQFIRLGDWFSEWNGPFRDDVRSFVKGDREMVGKLAARILASPDMYTRSDTDINRSINFITCHDGFTLNDLVSYNYKHNEANGEDSRDGCNNNYSWNCGVEGETTDKEVEELRLKQIKNFFTILFMSQGTPMFLMGDEVRRTQLGNNNAYCQNNEISWFNWDNVESHSGVLNFVKGLIGFIKGLEVFHIETKLAVCECDDPYFVWHGVRLHQPDWGDDSRSLAFTLAHPSCDEYLHVMFNAYWGSLVYELPPLPEGERWYRIVDTSLSSPDDFSPRKTAPLVDDNFYTVEPRSSVVLMAK